MLRIFRRPSLDETHNRAAKTSGERTQQLYQDLGPGIRSLRNRVRVLVEAPDDDKAAYATAVFRDQGWPVRAPRDAEVRELPAKNGSWLLPEVRLPGFARTKVTAKEAVQRIQRAAIRFNMEIWVHYAEVVSVPARRGFAYSLEQADREGDHSSRKTGLLMSHEPVAEADVRTMLMRFDLGNHIDPARVMIQPPSASTSADGQRVSGKAPRRSIIWLGFASLVGAPVFGVVAGWPLDGVKIIPLLISAALSLAGSVPLTRGQPPLSRAYLTACFMTGLTQAVAYSSRVRRLARNTSASVARSSACTP